MTTRPYTAVLIRENETRVINVNAPLERQKAHIHMKENFPGENVVALIPGEHAGHSYSYESIECKSPDAQIDLFDTSYITKNNA